MWLVVGGFAASGFHGWLVAASGGGGGGPQVGGDIVALDSDAAQVLCEGDLLC